MSRRFKVAYFAHSITSDWNNGNAHFLRGLLRGLLSLKHEVTAFEPADSWSLQNLKAEAEGAQSVAQFLDLYRDLAVHAYPASRIAEPDQWRGLLAGTDAVIVHEWNPPELARLLLDLRDELGYRLIFHDTHHRASSSPEQIALFGIDRFDGVLAFGESLRTIYKERFGMHQVWTLHEAADTSLFSPLPTVARSNDVVWIGNWGDGERSAEIKGFLLDPARKLPQYGFSIYGVRYPEDGLAALREAGVRYCGYLANLKAPSTYASARLTVHIPRQHYSTAMVGIPTIRVFEALACGIPLISAPWQDTEHLFQKGDYLEVHSEEEMRRAMQYLLSDREAAQAQAAQGLETVLKNHTCAHRALQLTEILEELVP